MELIYDIAENMNFPNEWVNIDQVIDRVVWFSIKNARYTCKTSKNGKRLIKGSIRIDLQ